MIKGRKIRFSSYHAPDTLLIGGLLALLAFGVLMVYDSSVVTSLNLFGGQYHYALRQLIWVVFGVAAALFLYFFDYHKLKKFALPLLLLTTVLLVLVLLPTPVSLEVRGSKSWLAFPVNLPVLEDISVQPSELAKLSLVLYLSALFSGKAKKVRGRQKIKAPRLLDFLLPTAVVAGLILLEPDVGTLVIVALLGVSAFFFAGASFWQLLVLVPGVLGGGAALALTSSSIMNRIKAFLNPEADVLGIGYQINQILIALGSGGILGIGIGESRQKYGYIPDISTDAVFAVVGEEFGFIGALVVISLFAFVVYRGFLIAKSAPDAFGRILAASITSWLGIQVLINLGGMTNLVPLTGVPLPFISYGGSSLIVMLSAFGILLNISKQTTRTRKAKR